MPVNTRMSPPSYKVFEPDALDAIYAKGQLDPVMGGIAYAFRKAHEGDSERAQADYLASQDRYNAMARDLDALEAKQRQDLALATVYAKSEDPLGVLKQDVLRSIAARNNASAANAGANSGPMTTVQNTYVTPEGQTVVTQRGRGNSVPIPQRPNAPGAGGAEYMPGGPGGVPPMSQQGPAVAPPQSVVPPGMPNTAPNLAAAQGHPGVAAAASQEGGMQIIQTAAGALNIPANRVGFTHGPTPGSVFAYDKMNPNGKGMIPISTANGAVIRGQ